MIRLVSFDAEPDFNQSDVWNMSLSSEIFIILGPVLWLFYLHRITVHDTHVPHYHSTSAFFTLLDFELASIKMKLKKVIWSVNSTAYAYLSANTCTKNNLHFGWNDISEMFLEHENLFVIFCHKDKDDQRS